MVTATDTDQATDSITVQIYVVDVDEAVEIDVDGVVQVDGAHTVEYLENSTDEVATFSDSDPEGCHADYLVAGDSR